MKSIQANILEFLDDRGNSEDEFHSLIDNLESLNFYSKKHEFKSFLHLLSKISNNHHRGIDFMSKIEKILDFFKTKMHENFTNYEIFNIFKRNKRIILFLLEDEIITIDEHIVSQFFTQKFIKENYPQYFMPEIKYFIEKEHLTKYDKTFIFQSDIDFYQKRKKGENDDKLCQIIQNDSIKDFVAFINKNNYSLNSSINSSIYETNLFLIKNADTELMEYAAFYGSVQILKYFINNKVDLTPRLWLYAIHSQNAELIQILEENKVEPKKDSLIESIKCHHNDFFRYIQEKYLTSFCSWDENISVDISISNLKYYNFSFMKWKSIKKLFFYICKYDYYFLVNILLNNKKIDINKKEILIKVFYVILNNAKFLSNFNKSQISI